MYVTPAQNINITDVTHKRQTRKHIKNKIDAKTVINTMKNITNSTNTTLMDGCRETHAIHYNKYKYNKICMLKSLQITCM